LRIVIIEDDAVVADTLRLYLEQAGYEAVVARNGIHGLEIACGEGVALVILDLDDSGSRSLQSVTTEINAADHDAHGANLRR
jgi:DNA-binding response OmpR family regulator